MFLNLINLAQNLPLASGAATLEQVVGSLHSSAQVLVTTMEPNTHEESGYRTHLSAQKQFQQVAL
jgi:hypothetical protein